MQKHAEHLSLPNIIEIISTRFHIRPLKDFLHQKIFLFGILKLREEGAEAGLLLEGKVTEYHVIHLVTKTVLAKTVAVQDVHNWSHRDMDKPYRDKKKA